MAKIIIKIFKIDVYKINICHLKFSELFKTYFYKIKINKISLIIKYNHKN